MVFVADPVAAAVPVERVQANPIQIATAIVLLLMRIHLVRTSLAAAYASEMNTA
jgi:hypothetical protein